MPIRKVVGGFKNKVVSLFNTNAPKETVHGREKYLGKPKPKKNLKKKNTIALEVFLY